ncbi:MAG: hypothetical protein M1814_006540 [Vezdaea aestivalis]|nr:MAG: hypothetical protein M1814_006540 [Vezdaea aestivalis]
MVKSYLKFVHEKTFGLIVSPQSNLLCNLPLTQSTFKTRKSSTGRAFVPANEEVLVWDLGTEEIVARWNDSKCTAAVTVIAQNGANKDVYAVGYADGSVRLWDSKINSVLVAFNGHRSATTQLVFDKEGVRLASGSKDTDIIIWDLVAETGLYKLRGHKDQITGLSFVEQHASGRNEPDDESKETTGIGSTGKSVVCLLSTSKDSLIKLWNLDTQYCIETHIAQTNGECWSMGVMPDVSSVVTAGNDGEVTFWALDLFQPLWKSKDVGDEGRSQGLKKKGTLYRHGKDRTNGISFDKSQHFVAFHGSEKAVEIYKIRSETEIRKSVARKRKRRREKEHAQGTASSNIENKASEGNNEQNDVSAATIEDMYAPLTIIRTGGRVASISWIRTSRSKHLELLVGTTNNLLEIYKVDMSTKSPEGQDYTRTQVVDSVGHRTDIRALSLSSDDKMLGSASSGSLKVWNIRTQNCIRTFECGYALCCTFLPGDKILLVGTKSGHLELFDVTSSTMIESLQAHDDAIWTLAVHPDGKSVVTGSADKTVKFWDFKVVQEAVLGTKKQISTLKLVQKRVLKLANDILSIRMTSDGRLLAVALLDYTVKVFFLDTLKLFLNLYGHKLPVLSMDISYDNKLLVTCSADKDIRIWGLDFGDCHKAIFAHQDSILQVAFMPNDQEGNGHHFFSASKDKLVKYWDGDKFQQIQKLEGHHGEIWGLVVSRNGDFVISASHDKSIRVWYQTEEQLFLEEERERELEVLYEGTLTKSLARDDREDDDGREVVETGKQTIDTLMAGERITEALEMGIEDFQSMEAWKSATKAGSKAPTPARNPIFMALGGISAERHVLNVIQKIQAAALHDALLVLSFTNVPALFIFIEVWLAKGWNMNLTIRVLYFITKTHHKQIVSSSALRVTFERIRAGLRQAVQREKNAGGFIMAGSNIIERTATDLGVKNFIDEESWDKPSNGAKKRKQAFIDVA